MIEVETITGGFHTESEKRGVVGEEWRYTPFLDVCLMLPVNHPERIAGSRLVDIAIASLLVNRPASRPLLAHAVVYSAPISEKFT